ncbi:hypothetical protein CIB48_g4046 [Xylaria polymorpha]|nr:hypothetical protein CIB48_g4046 [Xylaria polymorpha]
MLPFRRAIVFAAFFIIAFILIRRAHSPDTPNPIRKPPPKPATADKDGDSVRHAPSTSNPAQAGMDHRNDPTPAQKTIQDVSKMSLYDKLAYQYPYDVESKFPAYIWQTWKNTPADEGFEFRDQEGSWSYHHPAYEALPEPVLKADFFRYLILLARGGIYSDIDTFALKSALDWVPETVPQTSIGLIIGVEADPDRPDWKDWYSRRIQFCQWTIQSKPGHPVLRDIVSRITTETLKRKKEGLFVSKEKSIVEFTGPAIWTDTIFDYFNDPRYFDMKRSAGKITYLNFTGMEKSKKVGDVVILPITSFSPGVQQMGAGEYDDPMAFVKHDFEGMLPNINSYYHFALIALDVDPASWYLATVEGAIRD